MRSQALFGPRPTGAAGSGHGTGPHFSSGRCGSGPVRNSVGKRGKIDVSSLPSHGGRPVSAPARSHAVPARAFTRACSCGSFRSSSPGTCVPTPGAAAGPGPLPCPSLFASAFPGHGQRRSAGYPDSPSAPDGGQRRRHARGHDPGNFSPFAVKGVDIWCPGKTKPPPQAAGVVIFRFTSERNGIPSHGGRPHQPSTML